MSFLKTPVTLICKLGMSILCDIDSPEMSKVPMNGPLIIFANHTGTVEAPIVYTQLYPRKKITGFGKVEIWKNSFLSFIFNLWEIIPVNRGEGDMAALKRAYQSLDNGYIFGLAPEGTRSKDGTLLRAHGGMVMLALHGDVPLQPVAHWGGQDFGSNVKKFKRTKVTVRVGRRFRLNTEIEKVTKEVRQKMVDEMMYQLAKLLPAEFRGAYSDLENATEKYLVFLD